MPFVLDIFSLSSLTPLVFLREMEIESDHVGGLGMAAASDSEILDEGRNSEAVVVTLDADFHGLLAFSGASLPSVTVTARRIALRRLPLIAK